MSHSNENCNHKTSLKGHPYAAGAAAINTKGGITAFTDDFNHWCEKSTKQCVPQPPNWRRWRNALIGSFEENCKTIHPNAFMKCHSLRPKFKWKPHICRHQQCNFHQDPCLRKAQICTAANMHMILILQVWSTKWDHLTLHCQACQPSDQCSSWDPAKSDHWRWPQQVTFSPADSTRPKAHQTATPTPTIKAALDSGASANCFPASCKGTNDWPALPVKAARAQVANNGLITSTATVELASAQLPPISEQVDECMCGNNSWKSKKSQRGMKRKVSWGEKETHKWRPWKERRVKMWMVNKRNEKLQEIGSRRNKRETKSCCIEELMHCNMFWERGGGGNGLFLEETKQPNSSEDSKLEVKFDG